MPSGSRRRYDPEWKKRVADEAKKAGVPETARKHGLDPSVLRNWVNGKALGVPGSGKYFSPETKAAAVAEHAAGATTTALAAKYGVGESAIREWVKFGTGPITPAAKPGKRQPTYTPAKRAEVVRDAAQMGVAAAAAKHGVDKSTVYEWKKGGGEIRKRGTDLVLATNNALRTMNGSPLLTAKLGPHFREMLLRLRGQGVDIVAVDIANGVCTVTYQSKETFEL